MTFLGFGKKIFICFVIFSMCFSALSLEVNAASWWQNYKRSKATKQNAKKEEKKKKDEIKNPKNMMPQTFQDYLEQAEEIKNYSPKVPDPKAPEDKLFKNINPSRFKIEKYNKPPGTRNLDLTTLRKQRILNSTAVISADGSKAAYSAVYFNQTNNQTTSEIYYIPVEGNGALVDKIQKLNIVNKMSIPLIKTAMDTTRDNQQNVLTILDWAPDNEKLAVKETIGSKDDGIWQTYLWVYDFKTRSAQRLPEVREAIKYWWYHNKDIDLEKYRWDIYPLGWDASNPNRLVVLAFAYTNKTRKFLGEWSIDTEGDISYLKSLDTITSEIETSGLVLTPVK